MSSNENNRQGQQGGDKTASDPSQKGQQQQGQGQGSEQRKDGMNDKGEQDSSKKAI